MSLLAVNSLRRMCSLKCFRELRGVILARLIILPLLHSQIPSKKNTQFFKTNRFIIRTLVCTVVSKTALSQIPFSKSEWTCWWSHWFSKMMFQKIFRNINLFTPELQGRYKKYNKPFSLYAGTLLLKDFHRLLYFMVY